VLQIGAATSEVLHLVLCCRLMSTGSSMGGGKLNRLVKFTDAKTPDVIESSYISATFYLVHMNTLDRIRQTGFAIATSKGVIGQHKEAIIPFVEELVEDFIHRLLDDFFTFNTSEQFDGSYFNLFSRAYMYVYGKGAEYAFFTRLGHDVTRIDYSFDEAMRGVCAHLLPERVRFQFYKTMSAVLDMYVAVFELTRGPQERIISEGLSFPKCMYTILSGAFFCGRERILGMVLTAEDESVTYADREDAPYDYDSYNQSFQLEDFRITNVSFSS
jgi:hypothetical protein